MMKMIISGDLILPITLIGAIIAFIISIKEYTDDYGKVHMISKALLSAIFVGAICAVVMRFAAVIPIGIILLIILLIIL